jgi:rod shape-determining protein MreC
MLDFLQKYRLRLSIILIVGFLLVLLFSQIDRSRSDNWYSSFVQVVSYPFLTTYKFFENRVISVWTHYLWLIDVQSENTLLKTRVRMLEAENAENREMRIHYRRLIGLMEFDRRDRNKKRFASVIVEIDRPFSRLLVIDKGSKHGIKPNFAVVSPEGIVGKIQSVTPFQSVVQLITDSHSQFPVLVQQSRTKAMVFGSQDGALQLKYIPRRLELKENDMVVTSGLAGIYPKGMAVGKVHSIQKKSFELFQRIILTPSANLDKIEEVAVIVKNVGSIHQPLFTDGVD